MRSRVSQLVRLSLRIVWVALFCAVLWLWGRSYRHGELARLTRVRSTDQSIVARQLGAATGLGVLSLTYRISIFGRTESEELYVARRFGAEGWSVERAEQSPTLLPQRWDHRGGLRGPGLIAWAEHTGNVSEIRTQFRIVWLAIIGVLPLLPSLVRFLIRTRRSRTGRCCNCGYDLTGSQDRCPECGTAIDVAGTVNPESDRSGARATLDRK
jgi:hypothetical protein